MSNAPAIPTTPATGSLMEQLRGQAPTKRQARAAFWRMLALVRPHRKAMVWGMVLGLGVALTYAASLGGLLPVMKVVVEQENLHDWLLARAANTDAWRAALLAQAARLFPPSDSADARMKSLLILLAALVGANVVGNVLRCFSQYLVLYASQRMVMDLRRKMYRKALHLPMMAVSGEISNTVSQFQADVREILMGIVTLFGKIAREPLKAICVLAVALWLDAKLTLLVCAIAPVAVGLLWYFGRKVRKATVRLLQGYGLMLGTMEEALQGIDTVKGYTQQGSERRRMWQLERRMLKHQLRLGWVESVSSPLIEVVGIMMAAAGIVWLASRTFSPPGDPDHIEPSHFVTMVVLLTAMLDPVRKVANVYNIVQRSGAAATRVFAFLDQPEEASTHRPRQLASGAARSVRFEHVVFRYSADAPPAVNDVSLQVEPGECIAVVGPNGSGKSTLMRLLPRLLEPESGRVTIDGVPLRELGLADLRRQISIVSQRPAIFARTARENIAYGSDGAALEEVREAARRAYCAEFIERWPKQYETVLGEYGTSISGGQRQRIAIARAFLKRASILIFDEATSEIDADSERKIHDSLDDLRHGKTTFLIAHRHTVMEMADRIAVMDAGRLVAVGTRDQLLETCPLFVGLYRSPGSQ